MSNAIIKNSEIPHSELLFLYEENLVKLKKEYDDNVWIKSENKRLLERLETLKRKIKIAIE
jgi:hypothetical protein